MQKTANTLSVFEKSRHRSVSGIMWRTADVLALGDQQLVVDPAVLGEKIVGVGIVSGNDDIVGASETFKILFSPGVTFDNGHGQELLQLRRSAWRAGGGEVAAGAGEVRQ